MLLGLRLCSLETGFTLCFLILQCIHQLGKRIYQLPINTYSYLVEGHLSQGVVPLRNLVLGRYVSFFQKIALGPSREVTIIAKLATNDAQTTTAAKLKQVSDLTSRSCATGD